MPGIAFLAALGGACTPTGPATTAPTTAAATTAPVATTPASTTAVTAPPATASPTTPSAGVPGAAFAVFEPKAGATPSVQGGATLFSTAGQTQVVIGVVSSGTEAMAASIQAGTCDNLDPLIAYRLTEVAGGASSTTVAVDVATLLATPYSINISVAGSETESSITCGEIQPIAVP